jgi:hypothetical protein
VTKVEEAAVEPPAPERTGPAPVPKSAKPAQQMLTPLKARGWHADRDLVSIKIPRLTTARPSRFSGQVAGSPYGKFLLFSVLGDAHLSVDARP